MFFSRRKMLEDVLREQIRATTELSAKFRDFEIKKLELELANLERTAAARVVEEREKENLRAVKRDNIARARAARKSQQTAKNSAGCAVCADPFSAKLTAQEIAEHYQHKV